MSSSFSPDPRRTPTERLRDRLTKQVSMMSPVPESPAKVADLAPICREEHASEISESEQKGIRLS